VSRARPCRCVECERPRILLWWQWGLVWRLSTEGYGNLQVKLAEPTVTS
jgi:hypothetical protein